MQIYHRRYDSRRTAVLAGFSLFVAALMGWAFYKNATFQPVWLLFVLMPLVVIWIQRKPPLVFNEQGVKWTYALCEEKTLPRVGFIYWQDIEELTWLPRSEGGGSVFIEFHRGALQRNFPSVGASLPEKHHGEVVSILLLLHWLDADSEQVFNEMQNAWEKARDVAS
ncbi:hypothetical protein KRX19_09245 [Cardiobacteriaceae bacterium TAE3-ERU3]|nr:hypothetical protein [Cardiobacteriaceae bacterium TAE3-ERU3]